MILYLQLHFEWYCEKYFNSDISIMYDSSRRKCRKPYPFSGFSFRVKKRDESQEQPRLLERDPRDEKEGFGFEFPFLCAKLGANYIPEVMVIDPVTNQPVRLGSRGGSNEVKLLKSNNNEPTYSVRTSRSSELPRTKEQCRSTDPIVMAYFDDNQTQNNLQKLVCKGLITDEKINTALGCITNWYTTLHTLQLQQCNFTADLLKNFAWYLRDSNVKILSLDRNPIPEQNHHVLLQHTKLTHLSLQKCEIDDSGVKKIARELEFKDPPTIQTLVHLNLADNKIGDAGMQMLAYSLRTNRTLQEIALSNCSIGDEGAVALASIGMKFPLDSGELKHRKLRRSDCSNVAPGQFEPTGSPTSRNNKESYSDERSSVDRSKAQKETTPQTDVDMHPYIWDAVPEGLDMWCTGNFALKKIDLSNNKIGCVGARKFSEVLEYQLEKRNKDRKQDTGITHLMLQGNSMKENSHALQRIQDILAVDMREKRTPKGRSVTTSVIKTTMNSKTSKSTSARSAKEEGSKVSALMEPGTNGIPPKKEEKSLTRKTLKTIYIETNDTRTSFEEPQLYLSRNTRTANLSYKKSS